MTGKGGEEGGDGDNETYLTPPCRIVGTTAADMGPSRRWTWKSAAAGSSNFVGRGISDILLQASGIMASVFMSVEVAYPRHMHAMIYEAEHTVLFQCAFELGSSYPSLPVPSQA